MEERHRRAWEKLALYPLTRPRGATGRHSPRRRARAPTRPAPSRAVPLSTEPARVDADPRRADEIARALRLAQEGRERELEHALRTLGFTRRLTPRALAYAAEYHAMRAAAGEHGHAPHAGCVCALDGALAPALLARARAALGPDARFWRETGYLGSSAPVGYFSYVHALSAPATSAMDELIARVRALIMPHFPLVSRARYAEWWAHNRAHGCGHQLHFDSDNEGDGGVRNPIASVVLFLSAAGGPTLVTQQTLASNALAPHGWLAYPRENRLVAFDGRLLHSVVPGRAAFATDRRRVTVMVAFWRDIRTRDPPSGAGAGAGAAGASALGPARSFPDPRAPGTPAWVADFAPLGAADGGLSDSEGGAGCGGEVRVAPVVPVRPVWLHVQPAAEEPGGGGTGGQASLALPPYDELFQGL
ncbi:hypothetical protein KFE25_003809 [Diacronema lutheri]|uniref:Fe2OG dioxygenase domain-containing protein n=1 Tax=Diacronema lutheri TaxID=2081491 RepID=A0A8J6C9Z5_DIALT|nr:hypothetical protein KFE25_003809 [Diacronema lutheri]